MEENTNSMPGCGGNQFDWCHIFKASRQALQPEKIFLAALGLMITFVIGALLMDRIWISVGWGLDQKTLHASPLMVQSPDAGEATLGVFEAIVQHEKHCVDQALKAARKFEFTGGMGDIWSRLNQSGYAQTLPTVGDGYGLVAFILAMGKGLYWTATHQLLYTIIFGSLALTIWALFGGAICRISALQFARNEHLSMGEALSYSSQRFGAFFAAPLFPIGAVLLIGFALLVGGWIMSWSYVGWLPGGLFFGLALVGGGLIAFFVIGGAAGFSLMWPTTAVEGSDVFDSISRSLGYVYERAERTVVYALVAIVYGALVWLAVRVFAFVLAYSTHGFVSQAYPALDDMWVTPSFDQLYAEPASARDIEAWGGRNFTLPLIRVWVSIGGFLLYGYLVSYYFSASTIIYLLLRSRVDDTELDDVYIEPPPDSPLAPPPPEAASADS